jgi:hypothetical protein
MTDERICLEPEEVRALRELLAALSVMEEQFVRGDRVLEISNMAWRDLVMRPAQGLRRVTVRRLVPGR